MKIIGVDVGGTFTDIILTCTTTGEQYVHKVQSTPQSQDLAVLRGVEEILEQHSIKPDDIRLVVHGTTVATNAMLERTGARVVLLTTSGLEDVLEIGRQNRDEIYSLEATRAKPLVEREDRIGVNERVSAHGEIVTKLTNEDVRDVEKAVDMRRPDSVAISLLFSFKNQIHEKRLLESLRVSSESYIVASSEVLPEFREFERTSTTVLEAYLGPLVVNYMKRLDNAITKLCPNGRLTVMQSNGGTMLASQAQGRTIGLAISGLAGGAIGGWEIAKQNDMDRVITLDMGGTSCDISAIHGQIVVRPDNEVGGLPLRVPSVDVKTIGAGGGSIAWVDDAGILHVGPQSAGAVPGPAAYGTGGEHATVTDANLILGRLNPDYFLGGRVSLDVEKTNSAIENIASTLRMSIQESALGIIKISTANMVQAIREVTVERGIDPREMVLIPFGGAGPTQAVDIADALRIDRILVPPYPGITSAMGLVCTDLRVDLMQTLLIGACRENETRLLSVLKQLSADGRSKLIDQGAASGFRNIWKIDMRYSGQSHELIVDIPYECDDLVSESIKRFEDLHDDSYGYKLPERDIEWVTARAEVVAVSEDFKTLRYTETTVAEPVALRRVLMNDGTYQKSKIYRRWELAVDQIVTGPSIIEQLDTTTYIGQDWSAEQKANGALLMRRNEH